MDRERMGRGVACFSLAPSGKNKSEGLQKIWPCLPFPHSFFFIPSVVSLLLPMPSPAAALAAAALALALARPDWSGVYMNCAVRLPLGTPPALPALAAPDPAALESSSLRAATTAWADAIVGPESFAFGPDGTLYTGSANGTVWAVPPAGRGPPAPRALAHTGGRPVGLAWDATHARLLVACSVKGLLGLDPVTGRVALLASHAGAGPGGPGGLIFFANSVTALAPGVGGAGRAGGALFTASIDTPPPPPSAPGAWWQPAAAAPAALFSGVPTGRLLRYDEATGATTVLAAGLWFANGVALVDGGGAALVAETFGGRLVKVGLGPGGRGGEEEGRVTPFADLPGFPDGVALDPTRPASAWVAIVEAPPSPAVARGLAASRAARWVAARLPPAVAARGTPPLGLVVRVSTADGAILETRADAGGRVVRGVTSAVAGPDGRLYLGSLAGAGVQSVAV